MSSSFFFFFLSAGFQMSFHGHSCPSIIIICIQPRAVAGAEAGMARHVFFFFLSNWDGAPPGSWCPRQTAYSAYRERRYWLDTWCFSTFCLRMPRMCSIGFRSGDILGHSITFTFSSKAVVILVVCLGWLCWKTVSEGRASSSASECHSTCWNPCFPQWTAAPQYQQ